MQGNKEKIEQLKNKNEECSKKTGKRKKYLIVTWGCQMNNEDSEKLSGMLKNIGYLKTDKKSDADIIIFNTCCIRENAELKVYGNLGELKRLKKKNPDLIIAVCGCMMQQDNMAQKVSKRYPYVDIIFGTHNSYKFIDYLNKVENENTKVIEILDKEMEIIEGLPIDRESNIKASVTIMYGCNNFCTYCIVPFVRGRERSRKPTDIKNEIIDLVNSGYKEITLLGQNVNSYGKDLDEDISFADLLRSINQISGLERIRFMTSHPKDLSDDLISAISECNKVCEHIHLPVQSGSNNILKKMNRHYDINKYMEIVENIKKSIPGVAITTDIIVGFPGETESDFENTLKLVKDVEYDSAFTFIYSKRKGTPADEMTDQVPDDIKNERLDKLLKLVRDISFKKNKEYEGNVYEVLVEGLSKNNPNKVSGRTRTGKLVNFDGHIEDIGNIVNVKIIKAQSFSLLGTKV